MGELIIGGIAPLTSIDYPGELAAVVFTQGCPWRCVYCHNSELQRPRSESTICWERVLDFLQGRIGLLDAVVFSGGEPTAQAALIEAVQQVKGMGFKIGLHSAGIYPRRLARVLPYVDWLGLDVKGPAHVYETITGVSGSGLAAWQSAKLVVNSLSHYQIRITAHDHWLSQQHVEETQRELATLGATNITVQRAVGIR
ncbi:pyruvate formate lyase activating enzyme [Alteromonadaceae bacterium Bs31]|nr:pyruvate formate lyase activating enzyme [Alteromonadaceae bacterium Bs31]